MLHNSIQSQILCNSLHKQLLMAHHVWRDDDTVVTAAAAAALTTLGNAGSTTSPPTPPLTSPEVGCCLSPRRLLRCNPCSGLGSLAGGAAVVLSSSRSVRSSYCCLSSGLYGSMSSLTLSTGVGTSGCAGGSPGGSPVRLPHLVVMFQ